jgi:general secretion pathway protein F
MSTFRYVATPPPEVNGEARASSRRGELSASSPAEARAAIRRMGLMPISVKAVRARQRGEDETIPANFRGFRGFRGRWDEHLRGRRGFERAEMLDGLATLLESAVPLTQALETLQGDQALRRSRVKSALASLQRAVADGSSFSSAMSQLPGWFATTDIAAVHASERSGSLPATLRGLAEREEHSRDLAGRLAGALTYPFVVALAGVGVCVFLSLRTLPQLASILEGASIDTPGLTRIVMAIGQFIASWWWLLSIGFIALLVGCLIGPALAQRTGIALPSWLRSVLDRFSSDTRRRLVVSRVSLVLSDLLTSGVPIVDALRACASTVRGRSMREALLEAAQRIEAGDEPSQSIAPRKFGAEFVRLLEVGEATGELDSLLHRLGVRYERSCRRRIDRLARLIEPAVIIALAVLVGILVMAAVLPLVRLQEVL